MEQEVLKTNLLSIAVAGLLMALTGILLYLFRNELSGNVRYLMPIPPLGVASYIFVFNMYQYYSGNLPGSSLATVKEILISTAVAAFFFGIFSLLLVVIISLIKR
jgi:hypothetical protein